MHSLCRILNAQEKTMLKTKLYWRVLANFAFLLIILTAMTLLTLYLLSEIEKNFSFYVERN